MKVESIYLERTFNLGNYQSFKCGITLEVEEGEKAGEVADKARLFIKSELQKEKEANGTS